ncbi:MAG: hypothetical protein AAFV29_12515, partial [Myxococcota bacterium]
AALEGLTRNRAYLGREFLTWVLWASHDGRVLCHLDEAEVTVLIVGKVVLRGLAGEATELAVKGHMSAYSRVVRFAIDEGLLVHSARLRLQWGEQVYEVTTDAEFLDVRGAAVPAVAPGDDPDDEDDRLATRLTASEDAGRLIDSLWHAFMKVRIAPAWSKKTIPAIKTWLQDIDT